MKESLSQQTANLKHKNNRHKRWKGIVSILACMVVFCTVYALILPALTAEGTPHCGKEEHTHTEDCYEKKLICGKEEGEGAHHHTDECYREEQVLVCTTPESDGHQHTDDCYTEEQVLTCTNADPDHVHNDIDGCYTTERKLTCGKEEGEGAHHHTEECYETKRELICGQEENDGHQHTDDCYKKELVCGKEEHKHILACYSDPNADVEDGNVWQRTVSSVALTGNWGADLAAIAQTQNGYTESTANYAVAEDGQTIHGYTRYGAWANDPYRDNWSAQFADFCLSYAGVPTSAVPQNSDCSAWNYTIPDGYTPKTGDLLLLDTDSNGSTDHTGIVTSVSDSTLSAIVGDADKAVRNNTYNIGSETIKGYVSIPENPALATPTPEPTEEPEVTPEVTEEPTQEPEATPEVTGEPTQEPENKADDAADNEADENKTQDEDVKEDDAKKDDTANNEVTPTPIPTPELAENQFTATLYTDSSYSAEMENQTPITVSGQLPVNAVVKAYPVEDITMEDEEILYAWDISIFDEEGNLWEPEEGNSISVEFQIPEEVDESNDYSIYYIPEAGSEEKPEEITSQVTGDAISFDTEHFSVYALVRRAKAANSSTKDSYDLSNYITSARMEKKNGTSWESTKEFQDGDSVRISFTYKVENHSIINSENRQLHYTLPDNVKLEKQLVLPITGTIGSTTYDEKNNLGTCTINTDGTVILEFNDKFLETQGEFIGGFNFRGNVSLKDNKGEETFRFTADGDNYTIKPKTEESDLKIKKTSDNSEYGKIIYTIEASSVNGTGNDKVKISDTMWIGGLTVKDIKVGKPTVKKGEQKIEYEDYILSEKSDNSYSYDLTLPELAAGEKYIITYVVEYDNVNGVGNGISNSADIYKGDKKEGEASNWASIKKMLEKSGSAVDNNKNIKWSIKVNPDFAKGVAGDYTMSDILDTATIDPSKCSDFTIIKYDSSHNPKTDVTKTAYENGILRVEDGYCYEITYKTPVDFTKGSRITTTNKATVEKDDKTYSGEGSVTINKSDFFKDKKTNGSKVIYDNETKVVQQKWVLALNPVQGSQETITITDIMTNSEGGMDDKLHYTTLKLLKESFSQAKAYQYTSLVGYDKDGNSVPDENAKIVKFEVTIKPKSPNESWNGDTVNVSYKSIFVVNGLKDDKTIEVKNEATVNEISHDATATYKEPKRLFKAVIGTDNGLKYGNYEVDYDLTQKQLKYRINVRPLTTTEKFEVVDTLPIGLSVRAENVKIEFDNMKGWCEATKWFDNKQWKASDYVKVNIEGQKLILSFEPGFPKELIEDDNETFAITYTADIDDSFWNDLKNEEKTYKNVVNWNNVRTESQETTIKRKTSILSKEGEQLQEKDAHGKTIYKNQVRYYVTINPAGKKLNNGKNLTLVDKLNNIALDKVTVDLITDKVKLYGYNMENTSDHCKGKEFSASVFQFNYNNMEHAFTVTIPDEVPCVLEYVYEIKSMNATVIEFNNTVSLTGVAGSETHKPVTVTEASGGAWVKKSDVIEIIKVDADRYQLLLSGAKFKVEGYNLDDGKWEDKNIDSKKTDGKGTTNISINKLDRGRLYRLIESVAPEGYSISDTSYYFVPLNENQKSSDWVNQNSKVMNTLQIQSKDITFVEYHDFETIYVPNKSSSLKVTKLWLNSDGSVATGTKNVSVQLYRSKRKLGTDEVPNENDKYGVPVVLSPDSNYTYTWDNLEFTDTDGSTWYYTVKEVSNLAGYTTSYMNNVGIQSGEITITNKKIETNDYVLPETGGTGTNRFIAVGLSLMAASLMCEYVMRRKCRERRGK